MTESEYQEVNRQFSEKVNGPVDEFIVWLEENVEAMNKTLRYLLESKTDFTMSILRRIEQVRAADQINTQHKV